MKVEMSEKSYAVIKALLERELKDMADSFYEREIYAAVDAALDDMEKGAPL